MIIFFLWGHILLHTYNNNLLNLTWTESLLKNNYFYIFISIYTNLFYFILFYMYETMVLF